MDRESEAMDKDEAIDHEVVEIIKKNKKQKPEKVVKVVEEEVAPSVEDKKRNDKLKLKQ